MLVAARTAAWAKAVGGVPTARDYVQDGLICMWDGVENVGYGAHDGAATGWVDIVGGLQIPLCRDAFFTDDSFQIRVSDGWASSSEGNYCSEVYNKSVPQNLKDAFATTDSTTVECVWRIANKETSPNNNKEKVGMVFCPTESSYTEMGYTRYGNPKYITFGSTGHTGYVPMEDETISQSAVFTDNLDSVGYINSVRKVNQSGLRYGHRIFSSVYRPLVIGGHSYYRSWNFKHIVIHSIRLYNRALSQSDIAANYAIDKVRFGLT